jgi:hypothetical protein
MLAKSAASDNHQSARPPRLILIDAPFSSRLSRYSLITCRGNDWTQRPLVAAAVNHLKVRSCLIDGEVESRPQESAQGDKLKEFPTNHHAPPS